MMGGKQRIEFTIRPDGAVEEQVTGVPGPDCEKVTAAVEQALGEVANRDHTSDYYSTAENADESVSSRR